MENFINEMGIHIWEVDIDDARWDRFSAVLSADEHEKSERFRTMVLQLRYRRCRSVLRLLLAQYVGQHAADIEFFYGQFGKPEITNQPLYFNLSHSQHRALIAVSTHPIGVDIEYMDRSVDVLELLTLVCHPSEISMIMLLSPTERSLMFYRIWTQKEAYCKLLGIGLQRSLPTLYFNALSSSLFLKVCGDETCNAASFFVHNFVLRDKYTASVSFSFIEPKISLFAATPDRFS